MNACSDGPRRRLTTLPQECKTARLDMAHVAALRIYTSSTFRLINGPLRQVMPASGAGGGQYDTSGSGQQERHPLAFTTLCISDALKKLRACHMGKKDFMTTYLWRGMRDLTVATDFLQRGYPPGPWPLAPFRQ